MPRPREVERAALPYLVLGAALLAGAMLSCADSGSPGDAGDEAGAEASAEAGPSCVETRCPSLVGTRLPVPDGGAVTVCGQPANAGEGYVEWFDPAGNCVCRIDDGGTLTACDVVTPSQCGAQTTCGSCNATPACSWCVGSTMSPQPFCDFRPAFDCLTGQGTPVGPDCPP